jgi:hypothetical protein
MTLQPPWGKHDPNRNCRKPDYRTDFNNGGNSLGAGHSLTLDGFSPRARISHAAFADHTSSAANQGVIPDLQAIDVRLGPAFAQLLRRLRLGSLLGKFGRPTADATTCG